MRKFTLLLAAIPVLAFSSAVASADTNSSNLDLTIDMQDSTSSTGDSTSVVSTTSQQTNVSVTIQNFAFSPGTMTVPQGTTVTWTNRDNTAHTVTGDTGSGPASSLIQPGQSYSFTFATLGTFKYHCSIHPQMTGTVTVTASSSQSSSSGSAQPPAGSTSGSTYTNTATPTPSSTTALPSTGPTNLVALFAVPALLGSGLYYLRLLQSKKQPD